MAPLTIKAPPLLPPAPPVQLAFAGERCKGSQLGTRKGFRQLTHRVGPVVSPEGLKASAVAVADIFAEVTPNTCMKYVGRVAFTTTVISGSPACERSKLTLPLGM